MIGSAKNNKGFTLIELIMVIAIVGLISSISLTSLAAAREKTKDSVIIQEINQFRILMEQTHADTGSYENLQTSTWYGSETDCSNAVLPPLNSFKFKGPYAAKAVELCTKIVTNSKANFAGPFKLFIGSYLSYYSPFDAKTKFSIMAYLPGKDAYYCVGSGGRNSDTTTAANYTLWDQPGCFYDP